jgi:hypothetical protein
LSTSPDFPSPFRHAGRLIWDRHAIENYKRILMGLLPAERDPQAPIVFVTAKQLTEELPYGRRTIGRRMRGRVHDAPLAESAIAPLAAEV